MARCETKRGKPRLLFVSRRLPKTGHPAAFALLDHMVEDHELVYAPELCLRRSKDNVPWFLKGLFNICIASFLLTVGQPIVLCHLILHARITCRLNLSSRPVPRLPMAMVCLFTVFLNRWTSSWCISP